MHMPTLPRTRRGVVTCLRMVALMAGLIIGGQGSAMADEKDRGRIDVVGTGEIRAVPDIAQVSAGVTSEAETAGAALRANSEAMADVIALAKQRGIAAEDLGTSGLSLYPVYTQPKRTNVAGEPQAPQIVGFRASNQVSVTVRDMDAVGPLLDALVQSGANQINGISFVVSDADDRLDGARSAAVADARAKAELYAAAAGVRLGRLVSLSERSHGRPQPMPMARQMAMEAAVPVEPGAQTLRIDVFLSYEIAE